ncbi:MAG: ribosome silencing factor [Acutalibacteraceae bacterium]
MSSLETAKLAVRALYSKKGLDIKVIEIADISAIADYFVIATGTSSTHVKALADEVEDYLDRNGVSVSHTEGYRSNSWILLDYVDVVVHVFSDEAREYYDLERLWQDGKIVDMPEIELETERNHPLT